MQLSAHSCILLAVFFSSVDLSVSSIRSYHVCHGTKAEQAGTSGSIELREKCSLNLTNIGGKINIAGIRNDSSCIGNKGISANAQQYCVDESVKTTIIEISNESHLIITSRNAVPFEIFYYRGA